MVHSNIFKDRIKVYIKNISSTPTGISEPTMVLSKTLWGSVLELPIKVVDYNQNESQKKFIKITFRGRREFDVATTEFLHKTSNVYVPITTSYLAAGSDVQFTVVFCHQVDGLSGDLPTIEE